MPLQKTHSTAVCVDLEAVHSEGVIMRELILLFLSHGCAVSDACACECLCCATHFSSVISFVVADIVVVVVYVIFAGTTKAAANLRSHL